MKRVISVQTLGRAEDITSYLLNARAYAHDKSQTKLQMAHVINEKIIFHPVDLRSRYLFAKLFPQ